MKIFKITDLWQKKQKQPAKKRKPACLLEIEIESEYAKDEVWHMSPEDALRVAYSGHK